MTYKRMTYLEILEKKDLEEWRFPFREIWTPNKENEGTVRKKSATFKGKLMSGGIFKSIWK